jgi:hypothetical protein
MKTQCLTLLVLGSLTSSPGKAASSSELLNNLYSKSRIVDIEVTGANWDALRNQDPRGGYCNFDYIGSRYDWFQFDEVKINGVAYSNVGLKKKSWCGSPSKDKPGFNVKLDKYLKENGDIAKDVLGTVDLTLNNSLQDASLLRQCLSYEIFGKAGIAVPRCNVARIKVNNVDRGLYINLQPYKKTFFKEYYGPALGNLYEVPVSNFDFAALPKFAAEIDSFKDPEDLSLSDLRSVMNVLNNSASTLDDIRRLIDVDQFINYWAAEVLLTHYDGFALGSNNAYLYFDPLQGMQLLPWGTDQILSSTTPRETLQVYSVNRLAQRLNRFPEIRESLQAKLESLLADVWNEDELIQNLQAESIRLQNYLAPPERENLQRSAGLLYSNLRNRRSQIAAIFDTSSLGHIQSEAAEGFCINTQNYGRNKVANIYRCSDHPDQLWELRPYNQGFVYIRNRMSDNCINLQTSNEWASPNAWSCTEHPDQAWKVIREGDSIGFESMRAPGLCLAIDPVYEGASLVMRICDSGSAEQRWRFR